MAKLRIIFERLVFTHDCTCREASAGVYAEVVRESTYEDVQNVDLAFVRKYATPERAIRSEGLCFLSRTRSFCCKRSESHSVAKEATLIAYLSPQYMSSQTGILISDPERASVWKETKSRQRPKNLKPNDFERIDRAAKHLTAQKKAQSRTKVVQRSANSFDILSDSLT